jgi:hypothetical protein
LIHQVWEGRQASYQPMLGIINEYSG